jgi:hypothetical protein
VLEDESCGVRRSKDMEMPPMLTVGISGTEKRNERS